MKRQACFFLLAGALTTLIGCAAPVRPSVARYDLGERTTPAPGLSVSTVDVTPASWLAGPDMHYRLLYADAQRRHVYGESRWVAAPAELVAQSLRRQTTGATACRLTLVLDELEQRFDSPQRSHVRLDVRAQLLPARGDVVLAQRNVSVRDEAGVDAASTTGTMSAPGARAGAMATARAVDILSAQLATWLNALPDATKSACGKRV